ncbi:hypothetical protein FOZ63_002903, partial [Perkinsus olseni]
AKDKKARSSSCPTDDDHEAKDKKARSSSCPTDDDHEAKDKKARSSSRRTEDDHEAKDKKTGSSSCPTDDDREAKENHSTVSARWKTLWKSGSKRVKFVDDVTTGAQTKETLSSLREDEKDCARRIGHVFNEAKEKRSNDETSAEGFGLVWTSAADGDQLKPKKVKSPILAQLSTAPVRLTVRNLLSLLHQAYDIIGILTWCLLPIKLILRECYTKRLQYDDLATGHQSLETVKTIQKFNRLVDSTVISRFVDLSDTVVLYADASAFGLGYAICNANPREIFAASSRLVPLHSMSYSIVRKETLALEYALSFLIARSKDFPHSNNRVFYVLTDSSIVLQRVSRVLRHGHGNTATVWKTPKGWSTWETNHCKTIANHLETLRQIASPQPVHLCHCPGTANLADGYSRGLNPFGEAYQETERFLRELLISKTGHAVESAYGVDLVGFTAEDENSPRDTLPQSEERGDVNKVTTGLYPLIVAAQAEDPHTLICLSLLDPVQKETTTLAPHLRQRLQEYSHAERAKIRAMYVAVVEQGNAVLRLGVGRAIDENDPSGSPIYIPEAVRDTVISRLHSFFCHQPPKYLVAYAEKHYYCKGLRKAVRAYSRNCPGCQRSRGAKVWPDTRPRVIPKDFDVNCVLALDWVGPAREPYGTVAPVPYVGGQDDLHNPSSENEVPQYALHIYD